MDLLARRKTRYIWAAGGDEGFPIDVRKAFHCDTCGRILAIVLVHRKSLMALGAGANSRDRKLEWGTTN